MSKKILIVEDDLILEQTLRIILEKSGFEVISAPDAYIGFHLAKREKPNLVILDIKMPAGGGLSVLGNLRQSMYTRGIPVIVTTGSVLAEDEQQARSLGIKEYIKKPYSPKDLIDVINNILS